MDFAGEMIKLLKEKDKKIAALLRAIEPFQRRYNAASLSEALAHIGRDELETARHVYLDDNEGRSNEGGTIIRDR